MKQYLPFIFLLLAAAALPGQTTRGAFALSMHSFSPALSNSTLIAPTNGLGLSFGKVKNEQSGFDTDEDDYFTFGLGASAHYFVIDNFSLGLNFSAFAQNLKDESSPSETNLSLFLAGPELRYYFNTGARSKVFLRGNVSFGSARTKLESNTFDIDSKSSLTQYGFGLGWALFLRPNASLDLGLGYHGLQESVDAVDPFTMEPDDSTSTTSGVTIDLGFTIFLGRGI